MPRDDKRALPIRLKGGPLIPYQVHDLVMIIIEYVVMELCL